MQLRPATEFAICLLVAATTFLAISLARLSEEARRAMLSARPTVVEPVHYGPAEPTLRHETLNRLGGQ